MAKRMQADLIASGYEWICGKCEGLNKTHEIPRDGGDGAILFCTFCGQETEINTTDVEHARG